MATTLHENGKHEEAKLQLDSNVRNAGLLRRQRIEIDKAAKTNARRDVRRRILDDSTNAMLAQFADG